MIRIKYCQSVLITEHSRRLFEVDFMLLDIRYGFDRIGAFFKQ